MAKTSEIAFGGGCHWCTEAVFQALKGVAYVKQGFVASAGEANTFSEAVIVAYSNTKINLEDLILIHLHTHNATSSHSMRKKYRSAIYTFNVADADRATKALQRFQIHFEAKLITKVLPFVAFKSSDPMFHNYYLRDKEKPFCQLYIAPKLKLLQEKFKNFVDHSK
ncbi:peptide-methionine (S)-S-oxide reductase [Arenibacter certesii]|uniref:peptide-methionine (S)-S-oxide reductase n=1 Tax=Arenibacter certesii TaxID=228955 RepID=A0A918MJC4_9FLAO|nr:peptide-methionine (S)-S-oxide reductase [Arenibacter certesii]GGW30462.1 peptide methionine sulfoxide reductase MsrA 1 [Arenibacter certesii]